VKIRKAGSIKNSDGTAGHTLGSACEAAPLKPLT